MATDHGERLPWNRRHRGRFKRQDSKPHYMGHNEEGSSRGRHKPHGQDLQLGASKAMAGQVLREREVQGVARVPADKTEPGLEFIDVEVAVAAVLCGEIPFPAVPAERCACFSCCYDGGCSHTPAAHTGLLMVLAHKGEEESNSALCQFLLKE